MVTLEKFKGKIIAFLDEALPRFAANHPKEKPTTIGLYSSPGNGWVSLCINSGDTPTTNEENCPDFKFVEFDSIEFAEWQEESESEKPKIKISTTKTISPDPDDGDEGYNEPFFHFLVAIAKNYFTGARCPVGVMWVGVQLLDSGFEDFWTVGKVPSPAKAKFKSPVIQPHKNAEDFIFSPDEERVFYQVGNTLTAMKLATREILFAVKPATNVTHMDLSPDGSRLVVKNTSGRTLVVDAENGATLADFKNQREGEGDGVLFSPCGKFVVTVSWNGLLNVRDAQAGKVVFEDFQQGCMLTNLSTPEDRRFIIYSLAGTFDESAGRRTRHKLLLRDWPLSDGNIREVFSDHEITGCSTISPTGRFFAAAHFKEFTVTDLKTSKVIGRLPIGTYSKKMAWSHDERFIGLSVADVYHVLEMPSLKVRHQFSIQYANSITFSPSLKYVAVKGHIVPMDYLDTFIKSIKPSA